jgi:hypothetical protein
MFAAYALGLLDCKDISARCMLPIFLFLATKTDASVRMLNGSPAEQLLKPIMDYVEAKGGHMHDQTGLKVSAHAWGARGGGCIDDGRVAAAVDREHRVQRWPMVGPSHRCACGWGLGGVVLHHHRAVRNALCMV